MSELSGKPKEKLKRVLTPSIDDHAIPDKEFEDKGELQSIALNVVMKVLYSARVVRWDVFHP